MEELDRLVMTDLVALREQLLERIMISQPQMFDMVNAFLSGTKNRVGLEVTSSGTSVGQYTLHLDGLRISHAEARKIDPQINHPMLGAIRMYGIIEREVLERVLADQELLEKPLPSIGRYLPEITVKFLP